MRDKTTGGYDPPTTAPSDDPADTKVIWTLEIVPNLYSTAIPAQVRKNGTPIGLLYFSHMEDFQCLKTKIETPS